MAILIDNSPAFLRELRKRAAKAMRRVGGEAVDKMIELAAYDTGAMAGACEYTMKGDELEIDLEAGCRDWKSHWFEFGTEKMPARPFVGPATREMGPKLEKALAEEMASLSSAEVAAGQRQMRRARAKRSEREQAEATAFAERKRKGKEAWRHIRQRKAAHKANLVRQSAHTRANARVAKLRMAWIKQGLDPYQMILRNTRKRLGIR